MEKNHKPTLIYRNFPDCLRWVFFVMCFNVTLPLLVTWNGCCWKNKMEMFFIFYHHPPYVFSLNDPSCNLHFIENTILILFDFIFMLQSVKSKEENIVNDVKGSGCEVLQYCCYNNVNDTSGKCFSFHISSCFFTIIHPSS